MPGSYIRKCDLDQLKAEIESSKAPRGIKDITAPGYPEGNSYSDINLLVDVSAEIEEIQEWLLQSLSAMNNIPVQRAQYSVKFSRRTYFDGPVSITFSPDDPKNQTLISKIEAAYALERKRSPLW